MPRLFPWVERDHDHDWFPDLGAREFIPMHEVCLKCRAERHLMPWGQCLGGHAIQEHYTQDGELRPLSYCSGPR